ncbi:DUF4176 domain-containing protein [Paenibacillus sp.]|jgi:hypothetical protein|uniref:DUF4176 domain-containing protein n=1 Tax=Paenibacillus sp. TaxID=58172 RepID=UPI0028256197|nr:DUF4176 domain-containing protein [Paenibacillus sp.]MDR0266681.1 DUF4176 domain-containing protein [Paenibacillus sp.]
MKVRDHEKTLLPLGSVVLLKGAQKKLMIYGRKQIQMESNTLYDYLGVVFPEGYIDPNYTFLFNHGDINKIEFVGFSNDEEEKFHKLLEEVSIG